MDPAKQRGMNEKITDKARGMFEKATGYESFLGPLFLVCGVAVVLYFRLWDCCCFVFSFVGLLLFVFSFVGMLLFVLARVGLCLLLVWSVRRVDGWDGMGCEMGN